MNRTRLAGIKGPFQNYSTRAELAAALGVHPQTIKRWRAEGKIPDGEERGTNGWQLWSPEQVRRIIQWRTNRGEL